MTSTDAGRQAEAAAKVYLEMRGYKIIEQNYRRPQCEIDIVAQKDNVMHFVEVKYRRNSNQGGGLDYVTSTKLRQIRRAAETWVEEYKWKSNYQLSAIEITGPNYAVMNFIENAF
ncbi:MAG TPA: YraN family protein [Candidatus Saccharimonadales bacterium]|nr:YraN family protein [Candidatus Saccharimonadales bacterium]